MRKERFETVCKDGIILKGILLIPEATKAKDKLWGDVIKRLDNLI